MATPPLPTNPRPPGPDGRYIGTPPHSGPGPGAKFLKGTLRVIVPIGSMIVTYYLTNRFAGAALAQKLSLPPQVVPMLISMGVGGIARQITK